MFENRVKQGRNKQRIEQLANAHHCTNSEISPSCCQRFVAGMSIGASARKKAKSSAISTTKNTARMPHKLGKKSVSLLESVFCKMFFFIVNVNMSIALLLYIHAGRQAGNTLYFEKRYLPNLKKQVCKT